jgi:hypothetical protein
MRRTLQGAGIEMWQARFPSEMSLVRSSPLSVTAQPFLA